MRYADGGGLTAEGRVRRERVRLQAAEMFAQDTDPVLIAGELRASAKSVCQWRRAWRAGGPAALASKGPGGNGCKLDESQLAQLRAALEAGPAACGRDQDQRWTLARAVTLAARLFGVSCSLKGMSLLLRRLGFTPRPRFTGPWSATRRPSRSGGRRPGRRCEASGGDRRVGLLRGRGRAGAQAR
jgi:transposase